MSPRVRQHLERHGWKWTSGTIVAVAATIGTVLLNFGATLNKLEAQQNAPGPEPVYATVEYVDAQLDARCPAPKKHRKRAAPAPAPRPVQREGMARRLWHLIW